MTDRSISFEFFPPRTDAGREKLRACWGELEQTKPEFFSCTFGAGGSTQDGTRDTVLEIQQNSACDAAPHLSCIGTDKETVRSLLEAYAKGGIKRIVALRGDMPSGVVESGDFRYANELVEFIRAETGDQFKLEIAAYPEYHPESRSPTSDLDNFVRKANAGADSAITQYFYNADAYWRFVDAVRARGVDIPVVPGIMPITNCDQLIRFSDRCGAEIPRWIRRQLEAYGDDLPSLRAFGQDVVTALTADLLQGDVPGLHFYTLNNAGPSLSILQQLDI